MTFSLDENQAAALREHADAIRKQTVLLCKTLAVGKLLPKDGPTPEQLTHGLTAFADRMEKFAGSGTVNDGVRSSVTKRAMGAERAVTAALQSHVSEKTDLARRVLLSIGKRVRAAGKLLDQAREQEKPPEFLAGGSLEFIGAPGNLAGHIHDLIGHMPGLSEELSGGRKKLNTKEKTALTKCAADIRRTAGLCRKVSGNHFVPRLFEAQWKQCEEFAGFVEKGVTQGYVDRPRYFELEKACRQALTAVSGKIRELLYSPDTRANDPPGKLSDNPLILGISSIQRQIRTANGIVSGRRLPPPSQSDWIGGGR